MIAGSVESCFITGKKIMKNSAGAFERRYYRSEDGIVIMRFGNKRSAAGQNAAVSIIVEFEPILFTAAFDSAKKQRSCLNYLKAILRWNYTNMIPLGIFRRKYPMKF